MKNTLLNLRTTVCKELLIPSNKKHVSNMKLIFVWTLLYLNIAQFKPDENVSLATQQHNLT